MKLTGKYTVAEIAKLIGGKVIGDTDQRVLGINEIHRVEAGDLTFVDHPKYYKRVLNSQATTIIINTDDVDIPQGKTLILHDDPFVAYNALVERFTKFVPAQSMISSSATIGEGTVVQPGTFIGENVKIGKNCLIHANVTIYQDCVIGDEVIIHSGTVIGGDAFYYQRREDGYHKMITGGRVVLKDKVEIGANCTIDRGVSADTIIGEGTKLDNLVQIGHDVVIGKHCLLASMVGIAGTTTLEDNVILWGQVGVSKDLVIGEGAVVNAQSGVVGNLEGHKTYFGSPVQEYRQALRTLFYMRRLPELFKSKKK